MIAKRLLAIQKASSPPAPAATDVYYGYRSLILNMQGSAGSTTFTDSSPNNFTVTPYGNAQLVGDATYGTVASFDGSGDYLTVANNAAFNFGSGDFTVEFWYYYIGLPQAAARIFQTRNGDVYAGLSITHKYTNRGVGLAIGCSLNGSTWALNTGETGAFSVVANAWTHVAVVRIGTSLYCYINGIQYVISTTLSGSLYWNSADTPVIGGQTSPSRSINGLIGPLRISPWAVYKSNFTPSANLFPAVQGVPAQDPYYDKNSLLLNMQGSPSSTVFVDESPNAFALTPYGNAQLVSDATYGTVASFDGSGDYLTVANNAAFAFGTGDFTVEFWYYPFASLLNAGLVDLRSSAASSTGLLLRQGDNSTNGLSLTCWAGTPGGTTPATQTGLNLNSWNHIAAVRNSNYLTVYINGVGGSSVLRSINLTDQNFRFGAFVNATGSPNCANGLIGPLRITQGVARHTANFTPPTGLFPEIYNPYTTLPVSGAALWLDGADSSTLFTDAGVTPVAKSGDLIYQWSDKSGNNRHATQATSANRPTWVPPASGQNGFGVLNFNGSSNFLSILDSALLQFGTGDFTVLAVAKVSNASRGTTLQNTIMSKQYTSLEFSQYQGWVWAYLGGTSNSPNSGASSVTSNTIFSSHLRRENGATSVAVNGISGAAVTNTTNVSGSGVNLFIGCRNPVNASLYFQGVICELALIPRSISSAEISDWYNYCRSKWGTP